jgi:hypothetical protein
MVPPQSPPRRRLGGTPVPVLQWPPMTEDTGDRPRPTPTAEPATETPAGLPAGTTAALAADTGAVAPTLPSRTARVVGFVAILAAGAAGGFIGYAVADLQCRTDDCGVSLGLSTLVGAVLAAVGVAVVVQLALRAMNEWRVIEAREGREAARRARQRQPPAATRPRPRVR